MRGTMKRALLLLPLLALVFLAGCTLPSGTPQAGGATSGEDLSPQLKAELEELLSGLVALSANGAEVDVEILNATPMGPFYNLTVRIGPSTTNVFVTKDGKYIALGPVAEVEALKEEVDAQLKQLREGTKVPFEVETRGTAEGNASAPIKVVEFSDFQCPYCYRFYDLTLPQLRQNYIEEGKVAFYYRHFPLRFHPAAEPAAIASYCADQQGAFWAYHDRLFENHERLAQEGTTMDFYLSLAEELGLDVEAFRECLNSTSAREYVAQDYQAGLEYGVQGTPTFFIVVDKSVPKDRVLEAYSYVKGMGGKLLLTNESYVIVFSGALPYEVWDRVLSALEG